MCKSERASASKVVTLLLGGLVENSVQLFSRTLTAATAGLHRVSCLKKLSSFEKKGGEMDYLLLARSARCKTHTALVLVPLPAKPHTVWLLYV